MKLINAEKFAAGIVLMEMYFLGSGDGKDTEYKRGAIAAMQSIKELIKKVPADYDMDAVVEQLENERKFWENAYDSNSGKEKARSYEHAIEIAKGGGADGN